MPIGCMVPAVTPADTTPPYYRDGFCQAASKSALCKTNAYPLGYLLRDWIVHGPSLEPASVGDGRPVLRRAGLFRQAPSRQQLHLPLYRKVKLAPVRFAHQPRHSQVCRAIRTGRPVSGPLSVSFHCSCIRSAGMVAAMAIPPGRPAAKEVPDAFSTCDLMQESASLSITSGDIPACAGRPSIASITCWALQ